MMFHLQCLFPFVPFSMTFLRIPIGTLLSMHAGAVGMWIPFLDSCMRFRSSIWTMQGGDVFSSFSEFGIRNFRFHVRHFFFRPHPTVYVTNSSSNFLHAHLSHLYVPFSMAFLRIYRNFPIRACRRSRCVDSFPSFLDVRNSDACSQHR